MIQTSLITAFSFKRIRAVTESDRYWLGAQRYGLACTILSMWIMKFCAPQSGSGAVLWCNCTLFGKPVANKTRPWLHCWEGPWRGGRNRQAITSWITFSNPKRDCFESVHRPWWWCSQSILNLKTSNDYVDYLPDFTQTTIRNAENEQVKTDAFTTVFRRVVEPQKQRRRNYRTGRVLLLSIRQKKKVLSPLVPTGLRHCINTSLIECLAVNVQLSSLPVYRSD